MARTGRFGRLPTAAPDLSSQIVSLMEQWQAAEDRNILSAWSEGGRYNGRKVTDKMMLDYYRKRRNGYDRDDPEYTEWDNELWQLRFQISNEKVMTAYRMQKIGPMAVANHYKAWAQKMPKNSSYYRNLMASAGDFIKTAQAAAAAAKKGFDYAAMQERINALNKDVKAADTFFMGLDTWARSHGYIGGTERITDPEALNFFEGSDMQLLLEAGSSDDPDWKYIREGIQRYYPGFRGNITWDRIDEMIAMANNRRRRIIAEYRKAPSDYSSYIANLNEANRASNHLMTLRADLNIDKRMAKAWIDWVQGHSESTNPAEFLAGDTRFRQIVNASRKRAMSLGLTNEAAALDLMLQAIDGDASGLQGTQFTTGLFGPAFEQRGGYEQVAQSQMTMTEAVPLLQSHQAVLVPGEPPVSEVAQALGEALPRTWNIDEVPIDPATGRPAFTDPKFVVYPERMVLTPGQPAVSVGRRYEGVPIMMGDVLLGYRWDINGNYGWGIQDKTMVGGWAYTDIDPFDHNADMTVVPMDGHLEVRPNLEAAEQGLQTGTYPLAGKTPTQILDTMLGELPQDATVEQREARRDAIDVATDFYDAVQSGADIDIIGNVVPSDANQEELDRFMDVLEAQVPIWQEGATQSPVMSTVADPYIDSEGARRAWIRQQVRMSGYALPWDENIDGVYMAQDGTWKPRVTLQDEAYEMVGQVGAIARKEGEIANYVEPAPPATPEEAAQQTVTGGVPLSTAQQMRAATNSLKGDVISFRTQYADFGTLDRVREEMALATKGLSSEDPYLGFNMTNHDIVDGPESQYLEESLAVSMLNAKSEEHGAAIINSYADTGTLTDESPWLNSISQQSGNMTSTQAAVMGGIEVGREDRQQQWFDQFADQNEGYRPRAAVPPEALQRSIFAAPRYDPLMGRLVDESARSETLGPRIPSILTDPVKPPPNVKVASNISAMAAIPQTTQTAIKVPNVGVVAPAFQMPNIGNIRMPSFRPPPPVSVPMTTRTAMAVPGASAYSATTTPSGMRYDVLTGKTTPATS